MWPLGPALRSGRQVGVVVTREAFSGDAVGELREAVIEGVIMVAVLLQLDLLNVRAAFITLMAMPLSAWVARQAEASGQRARVVAAAALSSLVAGASLSFFMCQTRWLVSPLTLPLALRIFLAVASLPGLLIVPVSAQPLSRGSGDPV